MLEWVPGAPSLARNFTFNILQEIARDFGDMIPGDVRSRDFFILNKDFLNTSEEIVMCASQDRR